MEVLVVIGIIIFIIWLFSGNKSKSTYTPPTTKFEPIDLNASNAKLYHDLGWDCSERNDHKQAIDYYNKAITYKAQANYYNNRAYSKSKTDDYRGAIEDYNKAIQLKPNEALYWLNRGFTHSNFDKDDLACPDWTKAAQLGSEKAKEMLEKYCKPKTQAVSPPVRRATTSTANPNEATLNQLGISYLYHMTHKNNLENILQNGLLSHTQAHGGLNQVDIADNQVNTRRGRRETIHNRSIHDYVPLYFNPKNPMLFRRRNIQDDIVILAIDRNLILSQNSIFTDGNAASQGTRFFNSINQLTQLNWRCIKGEFWNDFADGKRIRCAEVLVFPRIEIASIKKIYSNNTTVTAFAANKARNFRNITVEQNNNLYFSSYFDSSFDNAEPADDLPF